MADEYKVVDPKRSIVKILVLGLGLLLLAAVILGVYFFTKVNKAVSSESVPVSFTVQRGASTKQIANQLREEKVIGNTYVFLLYAKMTGAAPKFQAGNYVLNRNMSIADIVDVITAGKVIRDERKVTIVEGWSNRQIAEYLESRKIFTQTEFAEALKKNIAFEFYDLARGYSYEGFLFPDTYQISRNGTAEELVKKMVMNFEAKVDDSLLKQMQEKNLSLKDVITLASIIEKEVGRNKEVITAEDREMMQKERELVASVFYNRLKIGMPLESDATVNYVTGKSDRRATIADTKIKSPYNTYQTKGLPPGPIGNPGLGSIKAAINPAISDYYYFLHDPEGVAYFGKTLSEHNQNRAKHLE
jgi:UPF0755 protein